MNAIHETVLSILPGADDNHRLVVLLRLGTSGSSWIELRQQSWGEGLGWFTQSTLPLEPHQVAALRGVLGGGGRPASASLPRAFRIIRDQTADTSAVRADSA
jgi:hypothetical protein